MEEPMIWHDQLKLINVRGNPGLNPPIRRRENEFVDTGVQPRHVFFRAQVVSPGAPINFVNNLLSLCKERCVIMEFACIEYL
jgi:hypothetical protein